MIGSTRLDRIQTLEYTDEPVIYETIDQDTIQRIPQREYLSSSDVKQDYQTINRAEQNPIKWGVISPIKQHQSTQNQLTDTTYEQTRPFIQDQYDPREKVRSTEEILQHLETPKRPAQNIIYNYGK
jgi:hypothetical protein